MPKPRCFIIGAKSIAIRCAEVCLQKDFDVRGVITEEQGFRLWALNRGISFVSPKSDLLLYLTREPFEYLFSVFNEHVLAPAILGLPLACAINYHDALLPRYAGLHAPSWALLHQETVHGITWHKMVAKVDEGEILKQRKLNLAPDETSLTLSQRCFAAAVESFEELLTELRSRAPTGEAQDLARRTYFGKFQRPPAAGLIRWDQTAAKSEALLRALDFGPFENPLASPKVLVGGGVFVTRRGRRIKAVLAELPGTVIALETDSITVATATEYLVLGGFETTGGDSLDAKECARRFGLCEGMRLPLFDEQTVRELDELNELVARHESFWLDRLKTWKPVSLGLRAMGEPINSSPSRLSWTVPDAVFDWLDRRSGGWTQGEFLLASLSAYVARISGEDAFDLDYPVAEARMEKFSYLFAAHVPLRVEVPPDAAFDLLLSTVRREMKEMRRRLTYARDLPGRQMQNRHRITPADFVRIAWTEESATRTPVEGGIVFLLPDQGAQGAVLFDPAHVEGSALRETVKAFCAFLVEVARSETQTLSRIPLVPAHLLPEWLETGQGPAAGSPVDRCVHDIIKDHSARTPAAQAIVHEGKCLTYAELERLSAHLAGILRESGAGPDRFVAIFMTRSIDMIIGVLATLKAGAAYLPIDPATPAERIAIMLDECRPCAVLTSEDGGGSLPQGGVPVIDVAEMRARPPQKQAEKPTAVSACNLAYAIYTSGSTGKPNAVLVEHRSLTHYAMAAGRQFGLGPEDRVLQFASLSFDASAEEIFPCLLSGATLVLRTDEMTRSPGTFLDRCKEWGITILDLPTTYWKHLVEAMHEKGRTLPSRVRLVLIGGERALPETWARWRLAGHRAVLWNTYGPTEATIVAAWCNLTAAPGQPAEREVPVGRPIPGVAAYVVDRNLQPVPRGAVGELVLTGPGLARGYLNNPELTAAKFIHHSFQDGREMRLYRTGDRFRYRSDDRLEFLGRLDEQIKIRGYRVEPGEIESLLSLHPDVQAAAVVTREDEDGRAFLACFFVPKEGEVVSVDSLRGWLSQRLPIHFVPARYCEMAELPLTPSGKVDRRNLRQRKPVVWSKMPHDQSPQTETQRTVATIWRNILRHESIGIHDNFFSLGGDSLQAVLIGVQLRNAFQREPSLRWVFEHPTVERLSRQIELSAPSTTILPISAESLGGIAQAHPTEGGSRLTGKCDKWWRMPLFGKTSECVVPLREEGKGSPLFIYPGGWAGDNELLVFAAMARHLSPDFSVYGLKHDFNRPNCRVAETLRQMARNFLGEIRQVQPRGPYRLLAECVSWIIVTEIARQLRQKGETISALVLLDPLWPESLKSGGGLGQTSMPPQVRRYYEVLAKGPIHPFADHVDVLAVEMRSSARHRLESWNIFEPSRLHVRQVPGDHFSYLRDHQSEMARELRRLLQRTPSDGIRPMAQIRKLP